MSTDKITQYVAQSKEVITGLQKTAEAQAAEITASKAELAKVAEAKTVEAAGLKKLASETANMLLQQRVIAAADLEKFASGLADPGAAHNMIRNLTLKLASAQAPIKMGKPGQQKVASADDGKLNADSMWEQRLQAAHGR